MSYQLIHGDCLDAIGAMPDAMFDAIITDPPYPGIKREYGYWEPDAWLDMMRLLVPELRRVLKPSGSCVMVLQPNSERVGKMRTWLWEFMAWVGKEWGIVQDVYWWNYTAIPSGGAAPRERGLTRASVKTCLWLGDETCYRNQGAVLWQKSDYTNTDRLAARWLNGGDTREERPSGQGVNYKNLYTTADERGGSTPFNLIPLPNAAPYISAGGHGHGAGTPLELCRWWTRYICPPGGAILDPFCGSGTVGIAALEHGAAFVGIERFDAYIPMAEGRLAEAAEKYATPQLRMAV